MGVPKFFRWLSERYPLAVQRHGSRVNKETFAEHYQQGEEEPPPPPEQEEDEDEEVKQVKQENKDHAPKTAGPRHLPYPNHIAPPDPLSTCGLPPQVDRLYIDMNGLIHGCSHSNFDQVGADNAQQQQQQRRRRRRRRTEAEIFGDLCYYLDRVVRDICPPQELLFLAIDGVAPRAKLNQQRARRYRSAKEGEIEETVYDAHMRQLLETTEPEPKDDNEDKEKGEFEVFSAAKQQSPPEAAEGPTEVEPGRFVGKFEMQDDRQSDLDEPEQSSDDDVKDKKQPRFHSNFITPGTPFFQRCTQHLRHFIQKKIATDPAWQRLTVILSGSNVPGEGEHKIVEFVREQQASKHYNPNLRHVIMGQDGDLILLGLATHEPNLCLLRERVLFLSARQHEQMKQSQSSNNNSSTLPIRSDSDDPAASYVASYIHNAHFEFLHMNVLRDYLALEFGILQPTTPADTDTNNKKQQPKLDLEHTIDDFVFLTFLVGNDFLPALPALDIGDAAFDLLFYTYREQRQHWIKEERKKEKKRKTTTTMPSQRQRVAENNDANTFSFCPYLTHGGRIVSGQRLEGFLQKVGSYEQRYYQYKESTTDLEEVRRLEAQYGQATTPDDDILQSKEEADRQKYRTLVAQGAAQQQQQQQAAGDGNKDNNNNNAFFVPAMATPVTTPPETPDRAAAAARREEEEEAKEQEGLLARIGGLLQMTVQRVVGTDDDKVAAEDNNNNQKKQHVTANVIVDDQDFKGRYYADKFGFSPFDQAKHLALRQAYMEGLVWTLQYYYVKTVSWEWYYPYHYGPMVSDLVGLDALLQRVHFADPGTPLRPFEQLLACMPASNHAILPKPYQRLMTQPDSPLAEFYPTSFTVDMNGKRWPWEAVVLLPFMDAHKLRQAAAHIEATCEFSPEELARNGVEEDVVFSHNPNAASSLPAMPPASVALHPRQFGGMDRDCTTVAVPKSQTPWQYKPLHDRQPPPQFHPRLLRGVLFPLDGMPTLQQSGSGGSVAGSSGVVVYSMRRKHLRINVHGSASRYATALLELANDLPETIIPLETLAEQLIGTTIYINYPHLLPALVTAVSDARTVMRGSHMDPNSSANLNHNQKKFTTRAWTPQEATERKQRRKDVLMAYLKGSGLPGTGGITIAGLTEPTLRAELEGAMQAHVLLTVRPFKALSTTSGMGEVPMQGQTFAKFEMEVPLFVTSWQPVAPDRRFLQAPSLLLEKDNPYQARPLVGPNGRLVSRFNNAASDDGTTRTTTETKGSGLLFGKTTKETKGSGHYLFGSSSSSRSFATWAAAPAAMDVPRRQYSFANLDARIVVSRRHRPSQPHHHRHHRIQRIRGPLPTFSGARGKALAVGALAAAAFLFAGADAATATSPFSISTTFPTIVTTTTPTRVGIQAVSCRGGGAAGPPQPTPTPPLHFAHGTTTLAFVYQGGLMVAVDSRASLGTFVGSKTVQKVLPIHPQLLGTMAGGAADCSFWFRKLAAQAALHHAKHPGQKWSAARASRVLANVLYEYRGAGLSMGTMILGYDHCDNGLPSQPRLFYVDDAGTRLEGDLFAVGSGSTYAMAVLDGAKAEERYRLSTPEAIRLAVQAIRYATFRDGSSGGFINVYHLGPERNAVWQRVFRQDVAAIVVEDDNDNNEPANVQEG